MPAAKTARKRLPRKPKAPAAPLARYAEREVTYYWGLPVRRGGVTCNERTALTIDTVLACVRYIAGSVAQVDYNVYERLDGGGKRYRPDHPVDWILDKEANPETPAVVFWETIVAHALLWHGGFAEVQRDGYGRPTWLWQITPDRVQMERIDGRQVYLVTNDDGSRVAIPADNMLHVRGLSWDGQSAYAVGRLCRAAFGGAIAQQEFANAYFENDATPGGVLTTPNTLSDPAYERMRSSWRQAHQGADRAHAIAVLEEATTFVPVSKDAQQSQLVETQQNTVEKIARVFGVPLSKIGSMAHTPGRASMEEDDRAAYKSCLRPWARKVECECDVKLFGRINRGQLFTLHDFSVLLKGSLKDVVEAGSMMLSYGGLDIDEYRDLVLDLNPIGEARGGKVRPFPRNFTVLEKAGENPPAASGGVASGDGPGVGSDNKRATARAGVGLAQPAADLAQAGPMPPQVRDAFAQLLRDKYGHLLRVESDKAHRAENKGQLGSHVVAYYTEGGLANVAEAIRPVLAALLLALGRPADGAGGFARSFAEDHAARSVRELGAGTWQHVWADGRAGEQALEHLQTLWESVR